MGMCARANIVWGFLVADDDRYAPNHEELDKYYYIGKTLAEKQGIHEPSVEFSDETKQEYSDYWDKRNTIEREANCEFVHGGYTEDSPDLIVCVKRLKQSGDYEEPSEIKPLDNPTDEDEKSLRKFCELMDIKEWREPKWYLVVSWG